MVSAPSDLPERVQLLVRVLVEDLLDALHLGAWAQPLLDGVYWVVVVGVVGLALGLGVVWVRRILARPAPGGPSAGALRVEVPPVDGALDLEAEWSRALAAGDGARALAALWAMVMEALGRVEGVAVRAGTTGREALEALARVWPHHPSLSELRKLGRVVEGHRFGGRAPALEQVRDLEPQVRRLVATVPLPTAGGVEGGRTP